MKRRLDPIFSPRSVAVVGASRDRDSIGYAILHNLILGEFNGTIFPVNRRAGSIHSLKAYPDLTSIPDPVDLAVIAVPKAHVVAVAEEAVRCGVGGLVVITAGFSETGGAGAELEEELGRVVSDGGLRMVGPNCMGVINTNSEVCLNATFAPTPAERGAIGFVSQSGALGVAILNAAADLGIGLTQFASMGNKTDVSGNDLLEYWEEDEETRVIGMYLESFGNPRRFTEVAKRVSRKKPIVLVKSGRTAEGARAATSHTGAIAGADVMVSAFLERCGILRANSIGELFDVSLALDRCSLPPGDRVAILTNAGGPAIMATDACVNLGLTIAELSSETEASLRAFLPSEASVSNPVDMIASATSESYARSLEVLLGDPGVDMVMVINVTPLLSNPIDILNALTERAAELDSGKPVIAVMMATEEFYEAAKRDRRHPPVYRFPESGARALAQLSRYAAWRRAPIEETPSFEVDDAAIEAELATVEDGYLSPASAFRVLELAGVPVADWRFVERSEVRQSAAEVGYPVVVKAEAPGLVHKSDVGAVAVGIQDEAALDVALAEMEEKLAQHDFKPSGFLIQEMASGGHEVIFGVSTDPRFGPLLMFGLGGRYVEVWSDVRFGVAPLAPREADEMIRGLRGVKLLEGVRGDAPADFEGLQDVLLRLGQLAHRHPRIVELDINPFLASAREVGGRAVDVRIRVSGE